MKNLAEGYSPRGLIVKGKTKEIWSTDDSGVVIAKSTNDITAGDGAKHDTFPGKADLANQTTCNVFNLLQRYHIPLAFIGQRDANSFLAKSCQMVAYEVVIRRLAWGSYLKRHPKTPKGWEFFEPVTEIYLKTTGRKWGDLDIPVDDPLVVFETNGKVKLYRPDKPESEQMSFVVLLDYPLRDLPEKLVEMKRIAQSVFLVIEDAWKRTGYILVDLKIEFGIDPAGNLVLADVIDNDSWRVVTSNWDHIDKQVYRDGGNLDDVAKRYQLVAELTGKFV